MKFFVSGSQSIKMRVTDFFLVSTAFQLLVFFIVFQFLFYAWASIKKYFWLLTTTKIDQVIPVSSMPLFLTLDFETKFNSLKIRPNNIFIHHSINDCNSSKIHSICPLESRNPQISCSRQWNMQIQLTYLIQNSQAIQWYLSTT